jgi:Phage head-tail joining protein
VRPQHVGRYRQRVQLWDVPEITQDSYGQPSINGTQITSSAADGCFAAEVRMLRGDEQLNVRQLFPTATHQVRMRWLGDAIPTNGSNNPNGLILERMYLIDSLDGSRLNILNANNVEKRNRMWLLTCEEKRSV